MCRAQGKLGVPALPEGREECEWPGAQRKGGGRPPQRWRAVQEMRSLHFSFLRRRGKKKKKKEREKHLSSSSKAVSIPKRMKNTLDDKQGGFIYVFFSSLKWVGWNSV